MFDGSAFLLHLLLVSVSLSIRLLCSRKVRRVTNGTSVKQAQGANEYGTVIAYLANNNTVKWLARGLTGEILIVMGVESAILQSRLTPPEMEVCCSCKGLVQHPTARLAQTRILPRLHIVTVTPGSIWGEPLSLSLLRAQ